MKHLILISLFLTGCYTNPSNNMTLDDYTSVNKTANNSNSSNDGLYQSAMKDGCSSGKNSSGMNWHAFSKNVDMYVNNPYYKNGWDDGFTKCKTEGDNLERAITDSLNRGW